MYVIILFLHFDIRLKIASFNISYILHTFNLNIYTYLYAYCLFKIPYCIFGWKLKLILILDVKILRQI